MTRTYTLLLVLVACSRPTADSKDPTTPAKCDEGKSCSSEGTTCTPAPVGSGWSHALMCQSGRWHEIEIAPLPTASAN